jgi:uncharacterized DUF497 family protein
VIITYRQNRRKHGMDFEVAALVFDDPCHPSEQGPLREREARWQTIGLVSKLLLVCHTWDEVAPSAMNSFSWMTRNSLACMSDAMVPI